jgi:hypothetical protein
VNPVPYVLEELGWLQFQQLCDSVLELEGGVNPNAWSGEADRRRHVELAHGLALPTLDLSVPGPVSVQAAWEREDPRVVITSRRGAPADAVAAVLRRDELAQVIEARPDLRLRMPSLLGIRPLDGLVGDDVDARSTLDPAAAYALARVYVPTGAHARALAVLARHRFAVLARPARAGRADRRDGCIAARARPRVSRAARRDARPARRPPFPSVTSSPCCIATRTASSSTARPTSSTV